MNEEEAGWVWEVSRIRERCSPRSPKRVAVGDAGASSIVSTMPNVAPQTPMDPQDSKQGHWFTEEVYAHESSLRAYLRKAFPWMRDVDDLVQDSLAKLWRRRDDPTIRSGKALLFATARNAAVDLHRRAKVVGIDSVAEMDELYVLDDRPDVAETVTRSEEIQLLSAAMQALPDRCRHVLTLAKLYGFSQKEIAAELGISEHTVESQIAKGMRLCTAFLREHGGGGRRR